MAKKFDVRSTWKYTGYTLSPEQEVALEKIRKMRSSVVALSCGLGKTLTALHYAKELVDKGVEGYKAPVRCVFAVPKAATHAFEREFVTKLGKEYLLLTCKNKNVTWGDVDKNSFIIVEQSYLKTILPALVKVAETYPTYLFIDEAHCLQDDKTELSKSLLAIREKCLGVVAMTGTPLMNSIEGLFNLYHFVFPKVFPSWNAFRNRYCITKDREIYMRKKGQAFNPYGNKRIVKEIIGYQNMEELNKYLDMLTVKGSKTYNTDYHFLKCDLDPCREESYVQAAQGLLVTKEAKDWGARLHDLQRVVDGNPQIRDDGTLVPYPSGVVPNKQKLLLDCLKQVMERDEACLVYVEYLETVDMIKGFLESQKDILGYHAIHVLSGEIPEATRASIEVLMEKRDIVLMTSSGTASRNLQKANNLILFNTSFSLGNIIQTIGRICRTDSAFDVQHIYVLEVEGTIDTYKVMLFKDHLALVDKLMGSECRSTLTCDYVEIDRSRMDYIKKSILWQKGAGSTIRGGKSRGKKKSADELIDNLKGSGTVIKKANFDDPSWGLDL